MISIDSALRDAQHFQQIRNLAIRATANLSFWGHRWITVRGYSGSLHINDLAKKILNVRIDQLGANDRYELRLLQRHINRIVYDFRIKELNACCITRIVLFVLKILGRKETPISFDIPSEQESQDICAKICSAIDENAPSETFREILFTDMISYGFLNPYLRMFPQDLGQAIIKAARHNHMPAIEVLLSTRAIPIFDCFRALVASIDNRNLPFICRLVVNDLYDWNNWSLHLDYALVPAAKTGNEEILRELIRYALPGDVSRGLALIEALQRGFRNIASILLEGNPPIHDANRSAAALIAAQMNDSENLQKILQNGPIHSHQCGEASIETSKHNSLADLNALLNNQPAISEECRGRAVIEAVKNENLQIVQRLLQKRRDCFRKSRPGGDFSRGEKEKRYLTRTSQFRAHQRDSSATNEKN